MNVKNNSIILLIFSTILFFSCEKENKDIFSETKWQLIGNSLESINDSDCTLEFDNEGNVSIGGNLDIPYSVDNNVITLLYPQPST
ncbi:MAG: hypothetical protein IKT84_01765, partial [Bacteroidales bacterium]|nr:hypothetical protein [Bacteroidales bacterium]